MLDVIEPLREAGFALHWLHPRTKRPISDDWSSKPVASLQKLRDSYPKDANMGVRLGEFSVVEGLFLHVLDVDVRVSALADEAFDRLFELVPGFESFPEVQSGSQTESRHFYFLSDRPFRSRKLAHSAGKFTDSKRKEHWNWEIELFGTGKQVAMPPSIHPDTGLPYRWIKPFDFDLVGMGLGPFLSADRVAALAPQAVPTLELSEDDEFLYAVRSAPADVSDAQIKETLSLLPLAEWCEDRDGWLQVGMALHHQYQGEPIGLDLWTDYSKQSKKFDPKDQKRVWRSFTAKPGGVRFPTLIQAAEAERERRAEADSEIDDLIGDATDEPDPDAPKVAWRSLLQLTEDKKSITSGLHNTVLLVRNDAGTRGLAQRNEFTGEVVQRGAPGKRALTKPSPKGCKQLRGTIWEVKDPINGDLWSDARDIAIRDTFEAPVRQGGHGIKLTDRDLKGAITMVAYENAFHPVREYLKSARWDGKARVESLFVDYLGAPDTPYCRSVARMFLVAAVTRIFEPGHKFDFAVILEGIQGKRKTSFIEKLARHWFAELDGDFGETKNMVEVMQGAWILELPELVGFSRSDVRQIKAFISRRTDKTRLAYERRAAEFPRQCIFIGSTNDDEYLRDDTGGRRFWPIHCEVASIDTDRLEREVDQIWAEAYGIYLAMRRKQPGGTLPLYLADAGAAAEASEIQEMRRIESAEDVMSGRIAEWLDQPVTDDSGFTDDDNPLPRDVTCTAEIWVECFHRDLASLNQTVSQQVGRAMKKVRGWHQGGPRKLPKWGTQRIFSRDFTLD